jgi:hypothetical protein
MKTLPVYPVQEIIPERITALPALPLFGHTEYIVRTLAGVILGTRTTIRQALELADSSDTRAQVFAIGEPSRF